VRVKFKATDLDKIAAAEEELMAEVGKRNTLTWTPPNGLGAPTQFVIVTSSMDYIPNDVAEVAVPAVGAVLDPVHRRALPPLDGHGPGAGTVTLGHDPALRRRLHQRSRMDRVPGLGTHTGTPARRCRAHQDRRRRQRPDDRHPHRRD
jgi:hypothetical protein